MKKPMYVFSCYCTCDYKTAKLRSTLFQTLTLTRKSCEDWSQDLNVRLGPFNQQQADQVQTSHKQLQIIMFDVRENLRKFTCQHLM